MDTNTLLIPEQVSRAAADVEQAKTRIKARSLQQAELRQADLADIGLISSGSAVVKAWTDSPSFKELSKVYAAITPERQPRQPRQPRQSKVLYPIDYLEGEKIRVFSLDKTQSVEVDKHQARFINAFIGAEDCDIDNTKKKGSLGNLGYTRNEARAIVEQIWEKLHLNGR